MTVNRRRFLAATAGATAAGPLAAPAIASEARTLTLATTWGRGPNGVHDCAQRVADRITAMSDGLLTVELYAAGELVAPFDVFDTVTAGQVDMYHGPDYWFTGQHPGYAFFTSVPFGMTGPEMGAWYYHGGGQELHDKLGEIFNLKSFLAGNTGAQSGGWFRRRIEIPEDFQGLRIRMPGLGGEVVARLGGDLVTLPGAEVYPALADGSIDGTEWVGPWADEIAGFKDLVPYYYTAGFHEPAGGLTLAVNREVFESLTPPQQVMVETAAAETHQWGLALFLARNGAAFARLRKAGVNVEQFPPAVWEALAAATAEIHAEKAADPLYAEIFESYSESMRAASSWLARSEVPYRDQRDRVQG